MRKHVSVIAVAAVFALLIGGYLYMVQYKPVTPQPTASSPLLADSSAYLIKEGKENIVGVKVKSLATDLDFYVENGSIKLRGKSEVVLDAAKASALFSTVSSIKSEGKMPESGEPLDFYGLGSDASNLAVTLKDGSIKSVFVGRQNVAKTHYFAKLSNETAINQVPNSVYNAIFAKIDEYRDTKMININFENLAEITLSGSASKTMKFAAKASTQSPDAGQAKAEAAKPGNPYPSSWSMVEPYKRDANDQRVVEKVITPLSQLTAQNVVEDAPTDLVKYGLSAPKFKVLLKEESGKSVTINIGNNSGTKTYVQVAGQARVISIDSSSLEFTTMSPIMYVSPLLYIASINDVDNVVVTSKERTYTLKVTGDNNQNTMKYFIDDKPANEKSFKLVYQDIIGVIIAEEFGGGIVANPSISVTYNFKDGNKVEVSYSVFDDRRYVGVVSTDKAPFIVLKKDIDKMMTDVANLQSDPQNPPAE